MGKKSREKKESRARQSSRDKGRIVEEIVASMHELPGVTVQRNVYVPAVNSTRKREIDVLLTSDLAGYPVRVAIECKNEKTATGAPQIDAFVGKLVDIGIPVQHGIYVAASGYTGGGIARAKQAGIKPLILKDVTKDSLTNSVVHAFQSIVYLLLEVVNVAVTNTVPRITESRDAFGFYDELGNVCGYLPDLIWKKWLEGEPLSTLGDHFLELTVPPNWHQVIDGKVESAISAAATVRIIGLIVTLSGTVTRHLLVEAAAKNVEKLHVNVTFDTSKEHYPVMVIETESQLSDLLSKPNAIRINVGRIRLPRIRVGPMYWPPSERTIIELASLARAVQAGEIQDPRQVDFKQLEGTNLTTIWEPIWPGQSISQKTTSG